MRYLFALISVIVIWVVVIVIASSTHLKTHDRLALYICVMVLTLAIYRIGFDKR